MAAQFRIKLSEAGVKHNGEVTETKRESEVAVIKQLFEIAASKEAEVKKCNCIIDCIEQVENLTDDCLEILFTKEDLGFLESALKVVASTPQGIPIGWLRFARPIFRQLENPEKVE